jgi:hypothetical protein
MHQHTLVGGNVLNINETPMKTKAVEPQNSANAAVDGQGTSNDVNDGTAVGGRGYGRPPRRRRSTAAALVRTAAKTMKTKAVEPHNKQMQSPKCCS